MWVSGSLMTLQHLAVELGVGAVHLKLDLLAELGGKIADDARQLLPGVADRLHARAHDAVLQFGGDVGQPLQRHLEFGFVVPAHDVEKLIAGQHQLGHHRHQVFERIDADADRLAGDLGVGLVRHRPCRHGFSAARTWSQACAAAGAAGPASRGTRAPVRRARPRPDAAAAPASAAPACRRCARPARLRLRACCTICSSWLDQVGVGALGLALMLLQARPECP